MTRNQAILNSNMVELYLEQYAGDCYISKEIYPYEVRIHFFSMNHTEDEVKILAEKLSAVRLSESELKFILNEKMKILTFDIVWDLL